MNMSTVKNNILNMIRGKEIALEECESRARKEGKVIKDIALYTAIEFLKMNLTDLRTILKDLERCAEIPERLV